MCKTEKKYLGIGSPIVDMLAKVNDEFVEGISGGKGGMELVSTEEMSDIVSKLDIEPVRACGGSAGNTSFALARLGADASFLGQLGNDTDGEFYARSFLEQGGDESRFKFIDNIHTARCLSLITPDSQRTMRTDLGAAALLDPDSITSDDFAGIDFVHVEGYLLFNPALARKVLQTAKESGCEVSLDLGSFEVVKAAGKDLEQLLQEYVDYVFSNEDEIKVFSGNDDPRQGLGYLGKFCRVAVVNMGAEGTLFCEQGAQAEFVPAFTADNVVDTTGAGDYWAAGFIWSVLEGRSLRQAAVAGAMLGCEVVQHLGAELTEEIWGRVITAVKQDV